jgi:GNAT superfamily N-acetyltransferase
MAVTVLMWEALDPDDPILPAVEHLYVATQAAAERIDWKYLLRAVSKRRLWRPGQWASHLLLTADAAQPTLPTGFVYGTLVPDYGGYVCYLGVDPSARQQGLATRLFEQLFRVLAADAGYEGVDLPFVIWESRRPALIASAEAWALWHARLKLFTRLGAYWLAGVELLTPNYAEPDGAPVPLQLFLQPWAEPASAFTPERLGQLVTGLERHVYRRTADNPLALGMLTPSLRPPAEAGRLTDSH